MDSYDADYTNSVAMVKLCRKDVENCTYEKRYDFLQRKFQATIVHEELSEPEPYCLPCLPASPRVQCDSSYSSLSSSSTQQRRLRHSFTLLTPDRKKIDVCRLAWCHVYGISHHVLDTLSQDYRMGVTEKDGDLFNDSSRPKYAAKEWNKICVEHGIRMDRKAVQAAIMPNSVTARIAFLWMSKYFDQFGETAPNAHGMRKQHLFLFANAHGMRKQHLFLFAAASLFNLYFTSR